MGIHCKTVTVYSAWFRNMRSLIYIWKKVFAGRCNILDGNNYNSSLCRNGIYNKKWNAI